MSGSSGRAAIALLGSLVGAGLGVATVFGVGEGGWGFVLPLVHAAATTAVVKVFAPG